MFLNYEESLQLATANINQFSSLFSMEEEVVIQDVFKTASSAQKSLIWKYYLISTMKNTTTHHHCARCCYCNLVQDGKLQRIQKHMLNCEKVGHEDKAQLYHHLRSLPALPQDKKEEVHDDNSLAMSSSQSSPTAPAFSSSTTLNKLQTGIQSYYGTVKLSIQMENNYALSLLHAIIIRHVYLSFVDSFCFQEFIQKVKLNWIVPSPTTFMDNQLVQLFATALENCNLKLNEEKVMTLLLEGLTDVSSNSFHGLILLFRYSESDILEILDFSSERHSAEKFVVGSIKHCELQLH